MTNPNDFDKTVPCKCTTGAASAMPPLDPANPLLSPHNSSTILSPLCSFLSVKTNGFTTCWKAVKGSGEVTNGNVHALIYYDNHARVHKVNWVNRDGLCAKLFIHFTNWGIFFSPSQPWDWLNSSTLLMSRSRREFSHKISCSWKT